MKCPLCRETDLEPRFASGTEVDVCPRCRGLWLDRGELERLLAADVDERAPQPAPSPPRRNDEYENRYDDRHPPKRKKSKAKKLADLFEEVLDL